MNRGVEIRNRYRPVDDFHAEFVCLANRSSGPKSAAGKQSAERLRMMAAASAAIELSGTSELSGDHNQRRIEQLRSFQILYQRRERLIQILNQQVLLPLPVVMRVPPGTIQEIEIE